MIEAKSEDEARKECSAKGYIFVKEDLNKGSDTSDDDTKQTYMCYKTTADKDKAICKINLLAMDTGYNIKDYNELQEEFKKANYGAAETMLLAATEFASNYKLGSPKAKDTYEGLNLLNVPEADGMKLGDYIVAGKATKDFFARILTNSSSATTNAIITLLSAGIAPFKNEYDDEKEELVNMTWAEKLKDNVLWDIVESDELTTDEEAELYKQYGDEADALFRQIFCSDTV